MIDQASLRTFVEWLLRDKPADLYTLIWTSNKMSHWYRAIDEIVESATIFSTAKLDTYIGCAWSMQDLGVSRRVRAKDAAGIPGLWTDIDILGKAHKKPNLPPDRESVIAYMAEIAPTPSLIVDSGHGLHYWWLFGDAWLFENESDRADAATLAKAWNDYIKARFSHRGWDVDAVADLARVMRLCGTANYKIKDDPQRSYLYERDENGSLYHPEDLRQWLKQHDVPLAALPAPIQSTPAPAMTAGEGFVVRMDANPPAEKWTALLESDPKVGLSWRRQRIDMTSRSMSEYDLSLASFAVHAGWTDQEIIDLIVAFRRMYGEIDKLSRIDYLAATLKKARSGDTKPVMSWELDVASVMDKIDTSVEDEDEGGVVERHNEIGNIKRVIDEDDRAKLMRAINMQLGLRPPIRCIIQYLSDPEVWYIEVNGERRKFGSVADIMKQEKWRDMIANGWLTLMPPFKKNEWTPVVRLILAAAIQETAGAESRDKGRILSWLQAYLDSTRVNMDDRNTAAWNEQPYWENGSIHIFGGSFRRWLKTSQLENISAKEMGVMLRAAGAVDVVINIQRKDGEGRTTKNVWRLPDMEGAPKPSEETI